jgi:hypothetical protein
MDSRICQTLTASPAEPGGLLLPLVGMEFCVGSRTRASLDLSVPFWDRYRSELAILLKGWSSFFLELAWVRLSGEEVWHQLLVLRLTPKFPM